MARFVKAANLTGILTYARCDGHSKNAPPFQFAGPFVGAWFHIIQQQFFQQLELNYEWQVIYDGHTGAELRAVSLSRWNPQKIHQDTLQMAFTLEKFADEIRLMKRASFTKYQKEQPKAFVTVQDCTSLEKWMYDNSWENNNETNKRSTNTIRTRLVD